MIYFFPTDEKAMPLCINPINKGGDKTSGSTESTTIVLSKRMASGQETKGQQWIWICRGLVWYAYDYRLYVPSAARWTWNCKILTKLVIVHLGALKSFPRPNSNVNQNLAQLSKVETQYPLTRVTSNFDISLLLKTKAIYLQDWVFLQFHSACRNIS